MQVREFSREWRLLIEARAGSSSALEALFSSHYDALKGDLKGRWYSAVRRRADAMDVLQDTMVEAFTHLQDFDYRGPGSFRSWLTGILHNRMRMTLTHHIQHQKRDLRREVRWPGCPRTQQQGRVELVSPERSPSSLVSLREMKQKLEHALGELPERYAAVIRMAKLEQKHLAEVAAIMGCSENAVKKLLVRALLQLCRAFGRSER
ncbi:MAG: sigma-70 family RNA polymerase sigma factor [Acidobacteria bacterium]|nr:sigma-70 family RNA polymerase sigma factor [Acidobacteriota bacterium]